MNLDGSGRRFDVAIAGAGLAGSALALLLAKAGARVMVLDPGRFPRDKLCGEFLSPECWGVLRRLGVSDAVVGAGYHPIRTIRLTTPRGRILEAPCSGPDGRAGIALSRSALDSLLLDRARAAGATVVEEARVGGPVLQDGRVVGLAARHTTHGPFEIRARLSVAADGRHSALVRRTGVTRGRSWFRPRLFGMKRHFRVQATGASEPEGTVGLHLIPGGYGGTCQVEGRLINFCGLFPESILRRHRGQLDRVADDIFSRNPALARLRAAGTAVGDWKTVSGVRVEVSTPRVGGIFYAGDCRGTVDPLGGQGMTMALLGSELLAPYLLESLATTGERAERTQRRRSQAAWRRRFDRRIRLCRLFHHALVNPYLIDLLARAPAASARLLAACFERTRDDRAG